MERHCGDLVGTLTKTFDWDKAKEGQWSDMVDMVEEDEAKGKEGSKKNKRQSVKPWKLV